MNEKTGEEGEAKQRRLSALRYPYYPLGTILEIAKRVFMERGGRLTEAGLAELLGTSKDKSVFAQRIIAGKLFNLLQSSGETIQVTDLALRIIKPRSEEDKSQALAQSFLSVPLFREIQNAFEGRPLPPEKGLKNALEVDFGILPGRVETAYDMLFKSATEAGLWRSIQGRTYLSGLPPKLPEIEVKQPPLVSQRAEAPTDLPYSGPPLPSAILNLLAELPPKGSSLGKDKKDRLKKALDAVIDLIYPTEG